MSIVQTAADVRGTALQGAVGDSAGHGSFDRFGSGFNQNPQAVQVTTVTVADPGDDTDITISINSVPVTINTGTGLALAAIGALLAAAINAEPLVRGAVIATFDTATLTLTGLTPGLVFTVTESDGALSAVTEVTAADSADPVPAGRAVVSQGYQAGEADLLVALAVSTLFSAQVVTATVVNGVATARKIRAYEVRGDERVLLVETVYTGNATEATEAAAIVAAFNTAAPPNTILAAVPSGADVTFTAEKVGSEIEIEIEQVNAGDITFANTTGPSPSTSLNRAFAGVSQRPLDEEVTTIGGTEPAWPGNAGVRFWTQAPVWVESAEAPTAGATAYVELAAGADTGKFFAASSATRVALARALARWERDGNVAADNLAVLRLNVA